MAKVILEKGERAQLLLAAAPAHFPYQDTVTIAPEGVAQFNEKYKARHFHKEDEVRFIDSGSGTFFVDLGRRPMGISVRVLHVGPGSWVEIPAGTVHRFQADETGFQARRFFKTVDGGQPIPAETK